MSICNFFDVISAHSKPKSKKMEKQRHNETRKSASRIRRQDSNYNFFVDSDKARKFEFNNAGDVQHQVNYVRSDIDRQGEDENENGPRDSILQPEEGFTPEESEDSLASQRESIFQPEQGFTPDQIEPPNEEYDRSIESEAATDVTPRIATPFESELERSSESPTGVPVSASRFRNFDPQKSAEMALESDHSDGSEVQTEGGVRSVVQHPETLSNTAAIERQYPRYFEREMQQEAIAANNEMAKVDQSAFEDSQRRYVREMQQYISGNTPQHLSRYIRNDNRYDDRASYRDAVPGQSDGENEEQDSRLLRSSLSRYLKNRDGISDDESSMPRDHTAEVEGAATQEEPVNSMIPDTSEPLDETQAHYTNESPQQTFESALFKHAAAIGESPTTGEVGRQMEENIQMQMDEANQAVQQTLAMQGAQKEDIDRVRQGYLSHAREFEGERERYAVDRDGHPMQEELPEERNFEETRSENTYPQETNADSYDKNADRLPKGGRFSPAPTEREQLSDPNDEVAERGFRADGQPSIPNDYRDQSEQAESERAESNSKERMYNENDQDEQQGRDSIARGPHFLAADEDKEAAINPLIHPDELINTFMKTLQFQNHLMAENERLSHAQMAPANVADPRDYQPPPGLQTQNAPQEAQAMPFTSPQQASMTGFLSNIASPTNQFFSPASQSPSVMEQLRPFVTSNRFPQAFAQPQPIQSIQSNLFNPPPMNGFFPQGPQMNSMVDTVPRNELEGKSTVGLNMPPGVPMLVVASPPSSTDTNQDTPEPKQVVEHKGISHQNYLEL